MERKLREVGATANIPLEECKLLIKTVETGISHYSPRNYRICLNQLGCTVGSTTHERNTESDGIHEHKNNPDHGLARNGHCGNAIIRLMGINLVWESSSRNGELGSEKKKKEVKQFVENAYTQGRQALWANLTDVESLEIEVQGFGLAVKILVHPSIITKGEVMEWLKVSELYETFDGRMRFSDVVHLFKDGFTMRLARVRGYIEVTRPHSRREAQQCSRSFKKVSRTSEAKRCRS